MLREYPNKAIRLLRYLVCFPTVTPTALDDHPKTFLGSNRSYQKFIVFAHQRSGSSMMTGTLRKHPQIVGFGELFVRDRLGFNVEGYDNHSVTFLALRNKYPVEFLERYVFSSYRADIMAVGFKLFPDQIDNDRFACLWQWLKQNRDLKIIYLTRQNLLATYTSLLIAQKDGRFGIRDESKRTKTNITICPKKCLAEFQKRKHYNEVIINCIKHHEVMEVTYEELAAEPYYYLKEVQEFLGVDVCDLEISTVKKETRRLSEIIDNYDELRQHFSGTEWEDFFDEE